MDIKPPKKCKSDYAQILLKAAAGAIPVAGSFLSEFIDTIIVPPYKKRQEEWMREVANRIEEIQEKVSTFKLDSLKVNEVFLDTMITATKAAIGTSSKNKREQLLNALQNVALTNNHENIIQISIFLNFIDKFTDAHIIICKILESPNDIRDPRGEYDTKETYRELINKKLQNLDKDIVDIVVKELFDNGLITISKSDLDNRPPHMEEGKPRITSFGEQFLKFITKPNLDNYS